MLMCRLAGVLCIFLILGFDRADMYKIYIKVFRIGSCLQYGELPAKITNVRIKQTETGSVISLRLLVTEDLGEMLSISIDALKCRSREALDTCEQYKTFRSSEFCGLITLQDQPWSPFTQKFFQTLECPLKKGEYRTNSSTFDITGMDYATEDNYWRMEFEVRDIETEKLVLCTNFEGTIFAQRRKI